MAGKLTDHMQDLLNPAIADLQQALERHDLPSALKVGDELCARCEADEFLSEHLGKIER